MICHITLQCATVKQLLTGQNKRNTKNTTTDVNQYSGSLGYACIQFKRNEVIHFSVSSNFSGMRL